jgi:hypothetical protein
VSRVQALDGIEEQVHFPLPRGLAGGAAEPDAPAD